MAATPGSKGAFFLGARPVQGSSGRTENAAAIAFGWTTLVAAQAGIGVMILNATRFLATDIVFLGIVVIGAVAFVFDLIMRRIERALVPWKGKA